MRFFCVFLVCLYSLSAIGKDFEPITGQAGVINSGTLLLDIYWIHLSGIDAPDGRQICKDGKGVSYQCGRIFAFALANWLDESQPITCKPESQDRYRNFVASCIRADGEDLGSFIVKNGYAITNNYPSGSYKTEQDQAKEAKVGIWQGEFTLPWEKRKKK